MIQHYRNIQYTKWDYLLCISCQAIFWVHDLEIFYKEKYAKCPICLTGKLHHYSYTPKEYLLQDDMISHFIGSETILEIPRHSREYELHVIDIISNLKLKNEIDYYV